MRGVARGAIPAGVVVVVLLGVGWQARQPSHDRDWVSDASRLPRAIMRGDTVRIENVRDFVHHADSSVDERWETRTYDVSLLETVWFGLAPFSRDWRGPAHAFLSFGFADSQHVAISVEARREVGETYSILKGMLKRFEITYVVGDERDLIGVRTERQLDEVYVYPIRARPDAVRRLFTSMLERANELAAQPEFYGSMRSNCTTAILSHVNGIGDMHIPYGWRVLVPGYSDELALELGLIDTELPLDAARSRFRVNDRARDNIDGDDFSTRIRAPSARWLRHELPVQRMRMEGLIILCRVWFSQSERELAPPLRRLPRPPSNSLTGGLSVCEGHPGTLDAWAGSPGDNAIASRVHAAVPTAASKSSTVHADATPPGRAGANTPGVWKPRPGSAPECLAGDTHRAAPARAGGRCAAAFRRKGSCRSRRAVKIAYRWQEYTCLGICVNRTISREFSSSPALFDFRFNGRSTG
jgi:hypothetical protein